MGWAKRGREKLQKRFDRQKYLLKKDTDVLILRKSDLGPDFDLVNDGEKFCQELQPFLTQISDLRTRIDVVAKTASEIQTLVADLKAIEGGDKEDLAKEKELCSKIDELSSETRESLNDCHQEMKELRKQIDEEDQKELEKEEQKKKEKESKSSKKKKKSKSHKKSKSSKKELIEDLTDEEASDDHSETGVKRSTGWRIRHNLIEVHLQPKIANAALEFQVTLNNYDKEMEKRAKTAFHNYFPEVSEEELDSIDLREEQELDRRFAGLKQVKSGDRALRDLREREREMRQIESTISSLHDILLDMGPMVEEQGDVLDQVEHNVYIAGGYTGDAATKVGQTEKIINSTRRKKFLIALTVGIIIFIICAVILCVVGGLILFLVVL